MPALTEADRTKLEQAASADSTAPFAARVGGSSENWLPSLTRRRTHWTSCPAVQHER